MRLNKLPFYANFYLIGIYLLPISIMHKTLATEISVFCIFISFFLFLSTFWTVKAERLLYFKYEKGKYIIFQNKLIKIEKDIFKNIIIEYFYLNGQKYIVEKNSVRNIIPKSDYKASEVINYYNNKLQNCECNNNINDSCINNIDDINDNCINNINDSCINNINTTINNCINHNDYNLYPDNSTRLTNNVDFISIFISQTTTPLFCFQIFSSFLMIFDEYVMQSLFSMGMTIFVEAMMAFSRVQTLKVFRGIEQKEVYLKILHFGNNCINNNCINNNCINNNCIKNNNTNNNSINNKNINKNCYNSKLLKSGDIFIINYKNSDIIPCDCILVEGEAIVNESMLSGEATPLKKISIKNYTNEIIEKRHILFGGTKILNKDEITVIALKTGGNTEQGILLTKMMEVDNSSIIDTEALKFVLILTVNAFIASILTIFYSKKSGYPLFLDIIILFTGSIPFELPMEMGISIQTAVRELMQKGIYCLEPFRMGLAGKVEICCFDKTGTLTSNKITLSKIIYSQNINNDITDNNANINNDITNNDKITENYPNINNNYDNINSFLNACNDLVEIDNSLQGDSIDMEIHKYLKENNLLIKYEIYKKFPFTSELKRQSVIAKINNKIYFIVKGAPEEIFKHTNISNNLYDFEKYTNQGYRVISIAYKEITNYNNLIDCNTYYNNLTFGAFILFKAALKEYSIEMVDLLQKSNHKIVVITGDNLLTAKKVSEDLKINNIKGIDMSTLSKNNISDLLNNNYNLFARANPSQKELILQEYKNKGFITMMVGDGTNDVGALKMADVGIAVIEPTTNIKNNNITNNNKNIIMDNMVPGDASIAAPFTIKSHSLKPIVEIIQQGRSTAVTTIQMYKIIALNSIINSFTMGTMDVIGLKFTEKQMLALGFLQSIAFNSISRSKVLDKISKERVVESIFTKYIILSIIGQSIIHIGSYYGILTMYYLNINDSIIKSSIFILTVFQAIATFGANYIGRPFREDIIENSQLLFSLLGLLGIATNCLINIYSEANILLEIPDLGNQKYFVGFVCLLVLFGTYILEKVCASFFIVNKKYNK